MRQKKKRTPGRLAGWSDFERNTYGLSESEMDARFERWMQEQRQMWTAAKYIQKRDWCLGFARRGRSRGGTVYFALAESTGLVKIGQSKKVSARLANIRHVEKLPTKPRLLVELPGGRAQEEWMHSKFRDLHARGEWFRYEEPLISFIDKLASLPEEMRAEAAR